MSDQADRKAEAIKRLGEAHFSRLTALEKIRELHGGDALSTSLMHVNALIEQGALAAAQTLLAACHTQALQLEHEARKLDQKVNPAFSR